VSSDFYENSDSQKAAYEADTSAQDFYATTVLCLSIMVYLPGQKLNLMIHKQLIDDSFPTYMKVLYI